MGIVANIRALTQTELDLLQHIGALNRQGTTAFELHQELLPSHGYGIDVILTMLNSLVTKNELTLPVPYGSASGPADPYQAKYRVVNESHLLAGNFLLAEMVRTDPDIT